PRAPVSRPSCAGRVPAPPSRWSCASDLRSRNVAVDCIPAAVPEGEGERGPMRKSSWVSVLLLAAVARAEDKKADRYPVMAPVEQYRMASAAEEIGLARSAAPAAVSA